MKFSQQLYRIVNRKKADLEDIAKGSLRDLGGMIMALTPVDTSNARNNWISELNKIDETTENPPGKGINDAARLLVEKTDILKLNDTFYFTNSVEYIYYLEFGSSKQAPAGMFRISLSKWPDIVLDNVKRVRR